MPKPIIDLELEPGYWLCIDPGNTKSGWLACVEDESVMGHLKIIGSGITSNRGIRRCLSFQRETHKETTLLIECPKPRGQPTAAEEMETLIEIGRMLQIWRGPWSYIFRQEAKIGITGMPAGKDKHVSQALKDRFGGEAIAVGGKKCKKCKGKKWVGRDHAECPECDGSGWENGHPPGVLADMSAHKWAALLLACWWQDSEQVLVHDIAGKQPVKKKTRTPRKSAVVP